MAIACFHYNRKKWDKTTAIDAQSEVEVPLFNARQDSWNEHFICSADGLSITKRQKSLICRTVIVGSSAFSHRRTDEVGTRQCRVLVRKLKLILS